MTTTSGTARPVKILVTGDVDGKFKELFNRINTVNKKNGPFDMLLCVGNFFPTSTNEQDENSFSVLDSIPPVDIPTYILGPTNSSQLKFYSNSSGCEIKPNITYLGQHGLYTESSGLKLVYLSGLEQKSKSSPKTEFEFDESDIHKLQMQFSNTQNQQGVDILITSQWPEYISDNVPQPTNKPTQASALVSSLASLLRPRYHFSGIEGVNYERAPYRNHQVLAEASRHVTRFIALGKVGNQTKTKWVYAFTVTPMTYMDQAELVMSPADVTDNPYIGKQLLKPKIDPTLADPKSSQQQFFYDSTYTGERQQYHHRGGGRGRGRGKRDYNQQDRGENAQGGKKFQERPPPTPCWFCLASPEVEKHLVVSIGENVYLTLAKGGLTKDHVLILPIGHFQSTVECPMEVLEEITKFKKALCKYFFSQSKIVVFYERNFRSPHLQIQCIPLPILKFGADSAKLNTLMSLCQDYSESESIDLQSVPSNVQIFQLAKPGFPYFFMEIFTPSNSESSKLFAPIQRGQHFPLQFGRELIGSEAVLNLADRIDWKQCKESQEEQTMWTQEFRNSFKSFDFTLM